jgi:hypothetical protein
MQYAQGEDVSPALDEAWKKFIQEVCGVFLFLALVVDGGLLPALSSLASQQANPTEKTIELCKNFLDFMATQEEAILTYRASKMVLQSTVMRCTSPNQKPAAELEATCSWPAMKKSLSTMEPSSTSHR